MCLHPSWSQSRRWNSPGNLVPRLATSVFISRGAVNGTVAVRIVKGVRPRLTIVRRVGIRMTALSSIAEEGVADLGRSISLHRRGHVAVQVREEAGVGVSQPLGSDLRRHATGEHQRGAGVA